MPLLEESLETFGNLEQRMEIIDFLYRILIQLPSPGVFYSERTRQELPLLPKGCLDLFTFLEETPSGPLRKRDSCTDSPWQMQKKMGNLILNARVLYTPQHILGQILWQLPPNALVWRWARTVSSTVCDSFGHESNRCLRLRPNSCLLQWVPSSRQCPEEAGPGTVLGQQNICWGESQTGGSCPSLLLLLAIHWWKRSGVLINCTAVLLIGTKKGPALSMRRQSLVELCTKSSVPCKIHHTTTICLTRLGRGRHNQISRTEVTEGHVLTHHHGQSELR